METLGIALYLLAGLVAAPVFCLVLLKLVKPRPAIAALALYVAIAVLAIFAVELLLVWGRGIIGAREFVGRGFFLLHVLVTFLAAPALACVLLLGNSSLAKWWPAVASACWLVGAAAIFYQYAVAETLYGIDGVNGPYSGS